MGEFVPSKVFLYVGIDPPESDDPKQFPFQFSELDDSRNIQIRVSLELLEEPTEMDPIYISLRLENDAGAGSWMSGYFTPIHHSHGGSYSYTSVCHCDGYSHVASLVDFDDEIFSFAEQNVQIPLGSRGAKSFFCTTIVSSLSAPVSCV